MLSPLDIGALKNTRHHLRKFKFPNMADIVKRHVQSCDVCQHVKAERRSTRGSLQPLKIPERKWHAVHMDWILGLPPWPPQVGTHDAELTFTDRATKMVHFVPTRRDEKATDTASYHALYCATARTSSKYNLRP